MGYSIEVYFDNLFEQKIRLLWDQLARAGVPSLYPGIGSRPHISLALLNSCIEDQISGILHHYFATFPKILIEFPAIALIPGRLQTVFLVPAGNIDLLEQQRTLFHLLEDSGHSPLPRHEPEKWLPHCSLSKELSAAEALKTVEICQSFGEFGTAMVAEAGFIEFRPTKEIKNYSII